jgi:hypothetical protein
VWFKGRTSVVVISKDVIKVPVGLGNFARKDPLVGHVHEACRQMGKSLFATCAKVSQMNEAGASDDEQMGGSSIFTVLEYSEYYFAGRSGTRTSSSTGCAEGHKADDAGVTLQCEGTSVD